MAKQGYWPNIHKLRHTPNEETAVAQPTATKEGDLKVDPRFSRKKARRSFSATSCSSRGPARNRRGHSSLDRLSRLARLRFFRLHRGDPGNSQAIRHQCRAGQQRGAFGRDGQRLANAWPARDVRDEERRPCTSPLMRSRSAISPGAHPEGGVVVVMGDDPWSDSTQVPRRLPLSLQAHLHADPGAEHQPGDEGLG